MLYCTLRDAFRLNLILWTKNDQSNFTFYFFWNMMSRHWEMGFLLFNTNTLLEKVGKGLTLDAASYYLYFADIFPVIISLIFLISRGSNSGWATFSLPSRKAPVQPSILCLFLLAPRLRVGGAALLPPPSACLDMWPIFLYVHIFQI